MRTATFLLTLVCAAPGCSPATHMVGLEVAPTLRPSPRNATVVFVRRGVPGVLTTLVDERGRFLGRLVHDQYTVAEMEPGPHRFVTWVHNAGTTPEMMEATLEAGRLYVVVNEVSGVFAVRAALRVPSSEAREAFLEGVSELRAVTRSSNEAPDNLPVEVVERQIARAARHWWRIGDLAREHRTLDSEDALTNPHGPARAAALLSRPAD